MNKPNPSPSHWLDVDEIKRRIEIAAVLEHYGLMSGLKGNGAQLTGHSPFREDERPSFSVNIEKGVWNDMGGRPEIDGKPVPGNVIGLVMAMERCSFRSALIFLQEKFIGQNYKTSATEETRSRTAEALRKEDSSKTENVPFNKELGGLRIEDIPYFSSKGIIKETIQAFGSGYCSRGLMKGRVVFPIRNIGGEIIAYAGRSARDGQEPKYRFPSGFKKQLELYNIDRLVKDERVAELVKHHGIILVEGFSDVMKLSQEGFPNVVALMGTDFHDAQRALLLNPKLNPNRKITLFLDNDEAGTKGCAAITSALIHNAFVRAVDYARVEKGTTNFSSLEPEHFSRDELSQLLEPQPALPIPNPPQS